MSAHTLESNARESNSISTSPSPAHSSTYSFKEALLEPLLRRMRLRRVLPTIRTFTNPSVLDIGCGWEAKALKEIAPFIARGIGIDFKAPSIIPASKGDKLHTFSYLFERKETLSTTSTLATSTALATSAAQICTGFAAPTNGGGGGSLSMEKSLASPAARTTKSCQNLQSSPPISPYHHAQLALPDSPYSTPSFPPENLTYLPFKDKSFDIVMMLAVLEHLHHPESMLQEIARVLKPSGAAIITVPSHAAKPVLEFLAFRLHIVSEAEIADHKRYFNRRDLEQILESIRESSPESKHAESNVGSSPESTPSLRLERHCYFQCGMNNFAIIRKSP